MMQQQPGQPMMMQQPGQPMMMQQPGQPMMMQQPGQPSYQQQPQMMYQQQPATTAMVVGGAMVISAQRGHPSYPLIWPEISVQVDCHFCQRTGLTIVDRTLTSQGWLVCLLLAICGCALCCCIPCCVDSMNIYTHRCSNCKAPLGARNQGMPVYY